MFPRIKYGCVFALFLLILFLFNVYFYYLLGNVNNNRPVFNLPSIYAYEPLPEEYKDIFEHLSHLPVYYKTRNRNFVYFQQALISYFNYSGTSESSTRDLFGNWAPDDSLFPYKNGTTGKLLQIILNSAVVMADNAPKGTQLKLLLLLENKQKLYFKPKRYELNHVIEGDTVYGGLDRHNSEVFAYYLARVLNFTWVAPVATRKLYIEKDILPVATDSLKNTMLTNKTTGSLCFYGECYYCTPEQTVCADKAGYLEGAAILYFHKPLKVQRSPWKRSYKKGIKMMWEKDNSFCDSSIIPSFSKRTITNFVDVAIFDFLIQNGDRHYYELYKDKIVLLDNGKGLGNPNVDFLDILAPLYQCCLISSSTWRHLLLLSGGSLSSSLRALAALWHEQLAAEPHFLALERRLLKVYATVQHCIARHGSSKVIHYDHL